MNLTIKAQVPVKQCFKATNTCFTDQEELIESFVLKFYFRFCPVKYHPFDAEVLDKYVVGDDYLPTWNVTSLKKYYVDMGFSMKESFNAYVRSLGKS